ncbi:MAG: alkaline phosphatase D family protein [Bacteroidota bacterium]
MNIKMILLDARYFRDELLWENPGTNNKAAKPNLNGEILGEEQWQWLEQQVEEPNIDLLIIASGIQILPEEHGFEKWANFPKERTKLFQLINAKLDKPLVLVTGSRHISEVSKIDLNGYNYPLYEFTSIV